MAPSLTGAEDLIQANPLRRAEPAASRPVLPARVKRYHLEQLLDRIGGSLGLRPARVAALIAMIRATSPDDWSDPTCDPVCYVSQEEMAERLGKTPRAVRKDEESLEGLGLLWRATAANGARRACGGMKLGMNFAPLIARYDELAAIDHERTSRIQRRKRLKLECSGARRFYCSAAAQLADLSPDHPLLEELEARYQALPARYAGLDVEALEALLQAIADLAKSADAALQMQRQTSGAAEADFLRYIQDTNHTGSETCNASDVDDRTARKRADDIPSAPAPQGAVENNEKKTAWADRGCKPELLESFTPTALYRACSGDFRLYLDAAKGERRSPSAHDFYAAASNMRPELGIHHSAWREACETLGDMGAALALLVIDANRYHPVRPIHSPGGSLRAWCRRAQAGQLNLTGSLIGLIERSRRDSGAGKESLAGPRSITGRGR